MKLSVVIPTHNPRPDFLARTLEALRAQSLGTGAWELIIIDNASDAPPRAGLGWHPRARVVSEPRVGLTRARLRGFAEAAGELVILVDDDNLLDPGHLAAVLAIEEAYPFLGTWSGAITLEFEDEASRPPEVYHQFLTTRKVQRALWSNDPSHNDSTPWGAGLCVRRKVFDAYAGLVASDPRRARLDLQGTTLVYGGDTDIAYAGCGIGLGKGVFPTLHMRHLIPRRRCEIANLLKSAEGQGYSEVLHGYLMNGTISGPRTDVVGIIGERLRELRAGTDERMIAAAKRRGAARARAELMSQETSR
jgi:glycosyltransferase involved in cell wall biosynthesis